VTFCAEMADRGECAGGTEDAEEGDEDCVEALGGCGFWEGVVGV
jgi:hypothetical protein